MGLALKQGAAEHPMGLITLQAQHLPVLRAILQKHGQHNNSLRRYSNEDVQPIPSAQLTALSASLTERLPLLLRLQPQRQSLPGWGQTRGHVLSG